MSITYTLVRSNLTTGARRLGTNGVITCLVNSGSLDQDVTVDLSIIGVEEGSQTRIFRRLRVLVDEEETGLAGVVLIRRIVLIVVDVDILRRVSLTRVEIDCLVAVLHYSELMLGVSDSNEDGAGTRSMVYTVDGIVDRLIPKQDITQHKVPWNA